MGGREHGFVLDARHRDAEGSAPVAGGQRGADHREVVRLGAAGGEDHLVRFGAERRGDGPLGLFHGGSRRAPEAMGGRGIPEALPEEGQHRLEHFRADRGGRGIVEIDQTLGHLAGI